MQSTIFHCVYRVPFVDSSVPRKLRASETENRCFSNLVRLAFPVVFFFIQLLLLIFHETILSLRCERACPCFLSSASLSLASRSSSPSFVLLVPPTLPFTPRLWILLSNTYVARALAIRSRPLARMQAYTYDAGACAHHMQANGKARVLISIFDAVTRTMLLAILVFPRELKASTVRWERRQRD